MNETAQILSQGSTKQGAAAEETTAAMETDGVQQNADNARHTGKIASSAAEYAKASAEAASHSVATSRALPSKLAFLTKLPVRRIYWP